MPESTITLIEPTPDSTLPQSRFERAQEGPSPEGMDLSALEAARKQDLGQAPAPTPKEKPTVKEAPAKAKSEPSKVESTEDPIPKDDAPVDDTPRNDLDAWRPKTSSKAAQWDQMKAKHQQEIADLRKQLEARSNPPEDLVKLQKERDDLQRTLREIAIERDPEFQSKFETQRTTALNVAKSAAGTKGEDLAKLLSLPQSAHRDEQIDSLLSDLPASAQRRINAALGHLEQIDIARTSEIELAKANWDKRQQEYQSQLQQNQTARQQKIQRAFEQTLQEWQDPDKGHFLYTKSDENDAEVQESIRKAKEILSGNLPESDMAKVALHVGALPRLHKFLQQVAQERDDALAQLEKIRGSTPDGSEARGSRTKGSDKVSKYGDPNYTDEFISQIEAARKRDGF